MAISNTLLKEFADITNDSEEETTNNELRATVKSTGDGVVYVQIDGNADSDGLTPASTTTNLAVGDRVYVTIQNHSAVVTGNITDPSATNTNLTDAVNNVSTKFEVLEDKITSEVKKLDDSMSTKIEQTEESITAVSKKVEDNTTSISTLKQTADGLSSEVSKKVGEDEIISKINQSAEAVTINANKINLDGITSITTDKDTIFGSTATITGGSITFSNGGSITSAKSGLINYEKPSGGMQIQASVIETTYLDATKMTGGKFTKMPTISIDDQNYTSSGYDLIRTVTPTSSMAGMNYEPYNITAPSYSAVGQMITNIKDLIPSTPDLSDYVNSISGSSSSSEGTKFVHDMSKNGNQISYTIYSVKSSDARLKTNISDIPDLEDVYMDLKPKRFKFDDRLDGYGTRWKYGFLAQDVVESFNKSGIDVEAETGIIFTVESDEIFHEKEVTGSDTIYKMDKDELHALHVQMIQKQQKTIEALTTRIEALEAKLNEKE